MHQLSWRDHITNLELPVYGNLTKLSTKQQQSNRDGWSLQATATETQSWQPVSLFYVSQPIGWRTGEDKKTTYVEILLKDTGLKTVDESAWGTLMCGKPYQPVSWQLDRSEWSSEWVRYMCCSMILGVFWLQYCIWQIAKGYCSLTQAPLNHFSRCMEKQQNDLGAQLPNHYSKSPNW